MTQTIKPNTCSCEITFETSEVNGDVIDAIPCKIHADIPLDELYKAILKDNKAKNDSVKSLPQIEKDSYLEEEKLKTSFDSDLI